jgi:hypothetical protein
VYLDYSSPNNGPFYTLSSSSHSSSKALAIMHMDIMHGHISMNLVSFISFKNFQFWADGMAQVVEHPPNKHEAQSSNPNTAEKKPKTKKTNKKNNTPGDVNENNQ